MPSHASSLAPRAKLALRGGGCVCSKQEGEPKKDKATSQILGHSDRERSPVKLRATNADKDFEVDDAHREAMHALQELDGQLIGALQRADIRLLRTAWLRTRPAGFLLPKRQELEASEASGESPSPLLSPVAAIDLLRAASRSVGVLTYGW